MASSKIHRPGTLFQKAKEFLSAPFIYAVIFPAVFLHLIAEVYHTICFPLYGLHYIDRKQHIKIDRHKLSYLPLLDKMNCMYCGYINGLFSYLTAIASATEKYWCPIRHAVRKGFIDPGHHKQFVKFGDQNDYQNLIEQQKKL